MQNSTLIFLPLHQATSLTRMGIIYQFAIRFITVKDIDKVDKRCVSVYDYDFDDYLVKAKENRIAKLKEVSLDPGWKRAYDIDGITIPEGTQVITFGNDACDSLGTTSYEIYFYYHDETHNYSEFIFADYERNRFMIIPKTINNSLPVKMKYSIGYNPYALEYTEDCCTVTYF